MSGAIPRTVIDRPREKSNGDMPKGVGNVMAPTSQPAPNRRMRKR